MVIGDLGAQWTPALLNEAFRYVLDGALLVALQKDRYWLGTTGLELDAGPYVTALEYATGKEAIVCGKPNAAFYLAAHDGRTLIIADSPPGGEAIDAPAATEARPGAGPPPFNSQHGSLRCGSSPSTSPSGRCWR